MKKKEPFPRVKKYPCMLAGIRVSQETFDALSSTVRARRIGLSDYVRSVLDEATRSGKATA